MKKISSFFLAAFAALSLAFNSYVTAYALVAEAAYQAAWAMLSILVSDIAATGIIPDFNMDFVNGMLEDSFIRAVESKYGITVDDAYEGMIKNSDGSLNSEYKRNMLNIINKYNSGNELTDQELALYKTISERTKEVYINMLQDFVDSGVLSQDEDTKALEYLLKTMNLESIINDDGYVRWTDVNNAIQGYIEMREKTEAFEASGGMHKVLENVLGMSGELFNDIYSVVNKAVINYINLSSTDELKTSCDFKLSSGSSTSYRFTLDLTGSVRFSEDSDIYKKISEIKSSGYAYLVAAHSSKDYYMVFESKYSDYGFAIKSISTRFKPYVGYNIISYNYKVHLYDLDGNFVQSQTYDDFSAIFSLLYWGNHDLTITGTVLEKLGITSYPSRMEYGDTAASVAGRNGAIPIDDIYKGSQDRTMPIDDIADTVIANGNSIDSAVDDVLKGVTAIDNVADDADDKTVIKTYTDSMSESIPKSQEAAKEETKTEDLELINTELGVPSFNLGDFKTSGLGSKFPFCIPFDLINCIKILVADREAPYIEIPFKIERLGIDEKIVIDFSKFESVAKVFRWCETLGFIGFLVIKTRGLIKG